MCRLLRLEAVLWVVQQFGSSTEVSLVLGVEGLVYEELEKKIISNDLRSCGRAQTRTYGQVVQTRHYRPVALVTVKACEQFRPEFAGGFDFGTGASTLTKRLVVAVVLEDPFLVVEVAEEGLYLVGAEEEEDIFLAGVEEAEDTILVGVVVAVVHPCLMVEVEVVLKNLEQPDRLEVVVVVVVEGAGLIQLL